MRTSVVDHRQPGALGAHRHDRRQRFGADRAVGVPDVGGVDRADLVRASTQARSNEPIGALPVDLQNAVMGRPILGRLSVDHDDPRPSPAGACYRSRFRPARRHGHPRVGFLPTRSRRPARCRDRARRGVPHLVRPGFRRCRRVPGAVRVLLRRPAAAHRADPGASLCADARGDPAGPAAAARAGGGARRVGGADDPDAAGDPLGDVCRPEPGQPRLLPELGVGQHRVGLPSRRRGGQSAAAHLVDVGAGPVLHRVPGAGLRVRLAVAPAARQAHADCASSCCSAR